MISVASRSARSPWLLSSWYWRSCSGAFVTPPEAPAFLRIADFGASSIDLMLYCFIRRLSEADMTAMVSDPKLQRHAAGRRVVYH